MDLKVLREIDLFKNLDPVQLSHLASNREERAVPKGTVIFVEGEPATEFFVISEGRVRISKVIPGMGEEALAILPAGTYFGEMEIIDDSPPRAAQGSYPGREPWGYPPPRPAQGLWGFGCSWMHGCV